MQPVDLTPPNFFQTWKPPVIASFFFTLLYLKVQSSVDYSSFDSVELWPETLQGNRYNNKFLFYKSTRHISLTDFILHESYFALLIKARVSMSWKEIHWQGVLFWFLIWTLAVRLKLFFLKKYKMWILPRYFAHEVLLEQVIATDKPIIHCDWFLRWKKKNIITAWFFSLMHESCRLLFHSVLACVESAEYI